MYTLIIPDLIQPLGEFAPVLSTPTLDKIIRFAHFQTQIKSRSQLLWDNLGAPDKLSVNQAYVSPVWQQMGMNSVNMIDGAYLGIQYDEAQTLCNDLNAFYRTEYHFDIIRPDLWRITLPHPIKWQVSSILDKSGMMSGEPPVSEDQSSWLHLSTEIAMFLHQHNINMHRKPPINAVWLWNLIPTVSSLPNFIASNSVWHNPIPLEKWDKTQSMVLLHDCMACANTGDVGQYTEILMRLDKQWFTPLYQAVKMGQIKQAQIICQQGIWQWGRYAHWAIWRKKRTWCDYANNFDF